MLSSAQKEKREESRPMLEDIRRQMTSFGSEIQSYLQKIDANVEDYKFSVEKQDDGLAVEVQFKASIHPKHKNFNTT